MRPWSRPLPEVVREPQNLSHREILLYGAWLAGWALNATAMGLHHRLCHVLGGIGLPHAGVHSVLLPYVVAWISSAAPGGDGATRRSALPGILAMARPVAAGPRN